jgi:hypothetical protein
MALQRVPLGTAAAEVMDRIREHLDRLPAPAVVYLEAGHYSGRHGPDDFARNSLRHALALGTGLVLDHKTDGKDRLKLVFGILKDDLGMTCDAVACYVAPRADQPDGGASLPADLEAILREHPLVKLDRLLLSTERTAKNRGLGLLRRIHESGNYPEGMFHQADPGPEGLYFGTWDRQQVLLSLINGDYWTAKCPTLMGQHYADILARLEQRFHAAHPTILVDFSDLMDRNKVGRGSEAALRYFWKRPEGAGPVVILNVFYDDPEGEYFIVDEFRSEDC